MAIAHEAGVDLPLDDFDRISSRVPLLADLKPSGRFVATDLYAAGGTALVAQRLLEAGVLHGEAPTVSGERSVPRRPWPSKHQARKSCVPPHSRSRRAWSRHPARNLAPEGAVIKVSGANRLVHRGPARVFDSEEAAFEAVQLQRIQPGDVVVIRYEGPSGGPGMREMLGVTSALMGAGWATLSRS